MPSELTLDEKRHLVRMLLDAYGRQDLETLLEQVHPEVEWVPPIALAEGREFVGHAGIREWWSDLTSTFERFSAEIEGAHECGDRLLTLGWLHSYGRKSSVEIHEEVGWIWGFRDGRISSMTIHLGHEAARAAAAGP